MTEQTELDFDKPDNDAELLQKLFDRADRILLKKLSNNDRDWARYENKHQAGVYIPHEQRDGGFFPKLEIKAREKKDADVIRECFFSTTWPQVDEKREDTRLVNYTSKGQETHMTRLPKAAFKDLLPASFLVMGRIPTENPIYYECLTIDSGSEEADLLAEIFGFDADFLIGEYEPVKVRTSERERILDFVEQVIKAWLDGKIDVFAENSAVMPNTVRLAQLAQESYLKKNALEKIDPFALKAPGDALREISRSIEWDLFRDFQRKEKSVQLVRAVLGDAPVKLDASDIIRRLIDEFPAIDALMLSASQQRKSRAGYSYEHHIEAMLTGGNIPFEKQVVIEAKKRPDFILPSLAFIDGDSEQAATGLILSAKTTLRERWKQVERERGKRALYLTTVDENIAGNAIEDMASLGIHLVIPESLMKSKSAEYEGHKNVVTFASFCTDVVKPHLTDWAP